MNKLFALILAVLMLAGCQLASEEQREDTTQDRLAGVFITFERLDLDFDIEGWLNVNGLNAENANVQSEGSLYLSGDTEVSGAGIFTATDDFISGG